MNTALLTTPPIPPKTLVALHQLNIFTLSDLHNLGAAKVFLLLKASGCTVTQSVLWQLEGLLQNCRAHELNETYKQFLLNQIKNHAPVAVFPEQAEMEHFMRLAMQQADFSVKNGEIPVGALVVRNGEILAVAHNACIQNCNISHHAEIRALAAAGAASGNYRLDGCDVYITLEPCAMCASALIQARVKRVIFGAAEPKTGAAGSIIDLFADTRLNKHTAICGGILAEECMAQLRRFFQTRRKKK